MQDFAAIDFETANNERSSVCSVGVVIVRGGEIVDKFYSLIKPEFCKGCSKCARNCPVNAISGVVKKPYTIDSNKCIKCGACKENCAFDAIYVEA